MLLMLLVLPLAYWLAQRSLSGLRRTRRVIVIVLRLTVLLLLVLALAGLSWVRFNDDQAVVFVLDYSNSLPDRLADQARAYICTAVEQKEPDDLVGLVVFGKNAYVERTPSQKMVLNGINTVLDRDHSDLSSALRLALACLPAGMGRRIVLISDGNENRGSVLDEAAFARQNNTVVDVLPVEYERQGEIHVDKVIAPSEVDRGQTYDVKVVVRSTRESSARLSLFEGSGLLVSNELVRLVPGPNVFSVQRKPTQSGFLTYEGVITPEIEEDDYFASNNRASSYVRVLGESKVLYLESDPEQGQHLAGALKKEQINVDLRGLKNLPHSLAELREYDAVILSNVSSDNFTDRELEMFKVYVSDLGGGLVMVGGPKGFGAGYYKGTPVEDALPVEMDVKQRQVALNGALVLIMHTCEFPDGNYWAKKISIAAIDQLSPFDEAGLCYYGNTGEQWLFRLQPMSNRRKVARLISGMRAGDMPSFDPTLRMAYESLKRTKAATKHVIVISDADPSKPAVALMDGIKKAGITVSTIAIWPHNVSDEKTMATIARYTGGRFYSVRNPKALPRIFIREAATVVRPLIDEKKFVPRVKVPTEVISGVKRMPPLHGMILTTPKELADVALVNDGGDPVLAQWQYGLGRAVAFTSDATSRWARDWVNWGGFGKFWAQTVRWSSREAETGALKVTQDWDDGKLRIAIDATDRDARFLNDLRITGSAISPSYERREVSFQQTGPGRYETTIRSDEAGPHFLSIGYVDGEGNRGTKLSGFTVPYSQEFRDLSPNSYLMERLAKETNGRILTPDDNVFERNLPAARNSQPMWQYMLIAALGVFFADVFARRVVIDYAKAWANMSGVVWGLWQRHESSRVTEQRISRLKDAKAVAQARFEKQSSPQEAAEPEGEAQDIDMTMSRNDTESGSGVKKAATKGKSESGEKKKEPPEPDSHTARLLRARKRARGQFKNKGQRTEEE